jgi:hypothetical protein
MRRSSDIDFLLGLSSRKVYVGMFLPPRLAIRVANGFSSVRPSWTQIRDEPLRKWVWEEHHFDAAEQLSTASLNPRHITSLP